MRKKICFLTLCFTLIFSFFVFASDKYSYIDTLSIPVDSVHPYYFITVREPSDSTYFQLFSSDKPLIGDDTVHCRSVAYHPNFDSQVWEPDYKEYTSNFSISDTVIRSNYDILNKDGTVFFQGPTPLHQELEMIEKSLGSQTKDFGVKLKVISGVGVLILSMLLGISLIPRLVRLFH